MRSRPNRGESLDVPVYSILQFLDWEDRFNLQHVIRGITTDFDSNTLLISWILERLLHESFVVTGEDTASWKELFKLRHCILHHGDNITRRDGTCALHRSFLASETAIESLISCSSIESLTPRVPSDDSDDGSDDAGDDKDKLRSVRTRRLMNRLSQSSRNALPYQLVYSPRSNTVTGLIENAPPRVFRFDKFIADARGILSTDASLRFINGKSQCVILTGQESVLVDTMRHIVIDLVSQSRQPIMRRSETLSPEVFTCNVQLSLIRFFHQKMDTLWSTDSLEVDIGEQISRYLTGLTGHLLFEFSLNFRYNKPRMGTHLSRFVVCIPSQPERARRGLSLDLLALKNCLRAIKSDSTFIPSRDSLLTHWLDMKQFSQIHLVTAVNDSTNTSRIESLNGLRFAEQFT